MINYLEKIKKLLHTWMNGIEHYTKSSLGNQALNLPFFFCLSFPTEPSKMMAVEPNLYDFFDKHDDTII